MTISCTYIPRTMMRLREYLTATHVNTNQNKLDFRSENLINFFERCEIQMIFEEGHWINIIQIEQIVIDPISWRLLSFRKTPQHSCKFFQSFIERIKLRCWFWIAILTMLISKFCWILFMHFVRHFTWVLREGLQISDFWGRNLSAGRL